MSQIMNPPSLAFIPESAPFNDEQRAWLNGFFAGWLGVAPGAAGGSGTQETAAAEVVKPVAETEEFPWHDPALPILDTATVVTIRLREGRPIYVGDSRHLSHRLVSLGMSPALAVATIYLMALGIGLGAVGLAHADLVHALLILVQALAVVAVVLVLLFYERRSPSRADGP